MYDPRDPRYAFDDQENRLRQALAAVLLEQYNYLAGYLEKNPEAVSVVAVAHQLLDHLRECLDGQLTHEVNVSRWWTLQQGACAQQITYLKLKAAALDLLKDMFASLARFGLSVQHEPHRT
jgi:hypothetical protein